MAVIQKVVCCFCGEGLLLKDAAVLNVQPNIESDEVQQLFCHKNHLTERMHKSIVLHPDFFEAEDEVE
jgi:hypothetical protein